MCSRLPALLKSRSQPKKRFPKSFHENFLLFHVFSLLLSLLSHVGRQHSTNVYQWKEKAKKNERFVYRVFSKRVFFGMEEEKWRGSSTSSSFVDLFAPSFSHFYSPWNFSSIYHRRRGKTTDFLSRLNDVNYLANKSKSIQSSEKNNKV